MYLIRIHLFRLIEIGSLFLIELHRGCIHLSMEFDEMKPWNILEYNGICWTTMEIGWDSYGIYWHAARAQKIDKNMWESQIGP